MFKQRIRTFSWFILSAFLFASCGKEVTVKTKTQLLTQSSWQFDKAIAGVFGDITSQIPACLKDNIYVFVSNGTGTIDESVNVCSPSTAGSLTWSFQNNETTLNLSATLFPGGSGIFSIVSLTETNLVISQMMTISPVPPTTVEITFKH